MVMNRVMCCVPLIGALILGWACGKEQPTAPSTVAPAATMTPPPPQRPVGQPVATYVFAGPLDYPVNVYTPGSQFLLYENGAFGLRYQAFEHVYLGMYRQDDATIIFWFDNSWGATGTLKGDLLEIRFSELMQHSDFHNAVYRRSQSSPPLTTLVRKTPTFGLLSRWRERGARQNPKPSVRAQNRRSGLVIW